MCQALIDLSLAQARLMYVGEAAETLEAGGKRGAAPATGGGGE